jgi:3-hydroxyacyl-[acyl-carrier-protein] dehydratase
MMDIDKIMALLPHRYPFLMIDRVVELDPGERAVAVKCVTVNEPQFQGHFPGNPIMPGVLLTEAFAQAAGIVALSAHEDMAGMTVYLLGLDKVRFRKPVRPGDQVLITAVKASERRGIWNFDVVATVDGVKVADGGVMATVAKQAD